VPGSATACPSNSCLDNQLPPAEIADPRHPRHSDGNIAERLTRSVDEASAPADVTILNAGSADYHGRQLLRVIRNDGWQE
jgi:hypothetical protein